MELKRKNREEKIRTHFRDPSKEENVLKLPEPDLFISKYSKLISQDISVLGYLFHLYTDRYFFASLFPKTFISLKSDGTIATKEKESHTIRILKNNKEVSDSIFWTGTSPLSIYSDYTILNKILLEYFSTSFDPDILLEYARFSFNNPGIEEVDYFRIAEIVLKTKKFIDLHTILNKVTGLLLFFLPLTFHFIELTYSFVVVCTIANIAAIQESYYIIKAKDR